MGTRRGDDWVSKPIGRGIVVVALAAAALLVGIVIIPRMENVFAGAAGIHDAASLPEQINICGRSWSKDALNREFSLAEIRARDGIEPVVVDPGLFASCPAGPCTTLAQSGPCDTVICVRVGEDAYLDYALQGRQYAHAARARDSEVDRVGGRSEISLAPPSLILSDTSRFRRSSGDRFSAR